MSKDETINEGQEGVTGKGKTGIKGVNEMVSRERTQEIKVK
jgi:hypothetical protein